MGEHRPRKVLSREDTEKRINELSELIDDERTDTLKRLSAIQQRINYKNVLKKFG